MKIWDIIWISWLTTVFISFGVLELISALMSYKYTLSDTTWQLFNVVPGQSIDHWTLPHLIVVVILLLIALILVFHLGLGLFR